MTELRESIELPVPAAQAEQSVLQYFERHRRADGSIEIPLRMMLADFGFPRGLSLERTVTVHISKQRDAENLNDEIAMRWDPGAGEPFPSFSGSMILWSEGNGKSFVELRGVYEPPLGPAGKLFDDAIGRLIAERTARQFLLALAEGARACFQNPA